MGHRVHLVYQKTVQNHDLTLLDPGFFACSSTGGGADSATLNFTPLNPFNWAETW